MGRLSARGAGGSTDRAAVRPGPVGPGCLAAGVTTGTAGDLTVRRTFGWGVLFVGDAHAAPVEVDPEAAVTWGREDQAAAVAVRHAQDVDLPAAPADDVVPPAEVTVRVRRGSTVGPTTAGVVAVPSGVLVVGDADGEDRVAVAPGRWRVQARLEPEESAEHVELWLSPLP